MFKNFGLYLILIGVLVCTQFLAFGQTPQTAEQRFTQPIVVNGQPAQGVLVVQNGSIQSYTCASPQTYATPDRASSGWACFDQASGQWLLHALPPQSANQGAPRPVPPASQPTVVYGAPLPAYVAPAVVPAYGYPYDYYAAFYPYGYYPYGYYPYFVGGGFGFRSGFGFRGPVIGARPFGGVSVVRAGGRIGGGRR